ncbi:hypothetical protein GPROT1_02173 [Gammaproteobacteria bacterium]|nr:hypothetical protein GPROT1_02173 [Gammaproteobacteria bacterium]
MQLMLEPAKFCNVKLVRCLVCSLFNLDYKQVVARFAFMHDYIWEYGY